MRNLLMLAIGLLGGMSCALAQEMESTPREVVAPPTAAPAAASAFAPAAPSFAPTGTVTASFQMTTGPVGGDTGFIPPDTMAAVGPAHVVEIINGNFQIFDKSGVSLDSRSLNSFWINIAGTGSGNGTFDPRIIYDPVSERWFASSIDGGNGNTMFLARSDTSDPTGDWDGVTFPADTIGNAEFHDYETLAVDADAITICTNDFNDGGNESCYSIDKADFLQAVPVLTLTRFEALGSQVTGSWQPAVSFGLSDGTTPLLGSTGGGLLRRDITYPGGVPTLGAAAVVAGDPGHAAPSAARQPDDDPLENVAPRFVGNVVEQGSSLWAVHAVLGTLGGNSALRWYEIDTGSNTVLQTGLIEAADEDYHEPSIAVNSSGFVLIGYTCSGPNLPASVCVSTGETIAGGTTFNPPEIRVLGDGPYYRDFFQPGQNPPDAKRNRWGDYSATVLDPSDPCTFWTFQQFVDTGAVEPPEIGPQGGNDTASVEAGLYGIQALEIVFDSCGPEADLTITKTDDVDPVIAGNNLVYRIDVENNGPSRALDIVMTDTLAAGEAFVSFAGTSADWTCNHTNGIVTCDHVGGNPAGSLPGGVIADPIFITVQVLPETRDDLINNANVVSSTFDPQPANNFTEEDTEVLAEADLSITKGGGPAPVVAGTNLSYVVQATNNGPSSSDNMQIVDVVPAGTTFVSASPSAGGSCSTPSVGSTGTVTCTWSGTTPATPAPNATRTLNMVVNVNSGVLAGTIIQNTATTNSTTTDPVSGNNVAVDNKPVITQAVVTVDKTDDPFDPVVAGQDDIFYKITVTNTGPSDAQNVVAVDTLPAGVTFVATNGCGEDPNVAIGGVFTCTVGTVTAGSSVVIVVRVSVDPMTVGLITNTVDVTWVDSSPVDNMAQATEDTTVLSVADVSITKADDPDPVLAGALLTYTVTVTNAGPSDAQSVNVTDTLPAEVSFQSTTGCLNDPNGVPVCMLGTVPAGASVNYTIEVLVDSNAPDGTITNTVTAVVGGGSTDPDLSNNTASEDTVIMRLLAASQPGSALIFPLFDVNDGSGSRDAKSSTFKLTNLGLFDNVTVHLVRVCGGVKGFGGKGLCQASDRTLTLTPGETAIRDVASFFNIDRSLCPSGYIVAYAQGPDGVPIVYDRLIGSMHINGAGPLNQRTTALTAIAVQAAGGQVEGDPVQGALGGTFPELPFDGLGYRPLPERLQTDFLATAGTRHSELVLLTLDIKAGAQNLPTLVALDWTNQDEVPFSGALEYVCHVYVRLDDEVNPEQPGAGVQGGGGFRASGLGSTYGLLEVESSGSDAVLGVLLEAGQNRLTLRHLLHQRDGAKTTTFIGR